MMTVLPTPAPPKRPTLPPLLYGSEKIDDLDAGFEDFGLGVLIFEARRRPVNGNRFFLS